MVTRHQPKHSFNGWTLNYNKFLNSEDWGGSIQYLIYEAASGGPFAMGLEYNYKLIDNKNHFGFKPIIGITIKRYTVTYSYNFDFYRIESERIRQHEINFGAHFTLLKRK